MNNVRISSMIVKCGLCDSYKSKKISRIDRYKLFKCIVCQVIFVYPQPNLSRTKEYNLALYDSKESIEQYFKMQNIFYRRAENCISILNKYKSTGYLLEVGCSFGFYLQTFEKNGYRTVGIDISSKAVEYITSRLGLNAVTGRFDTFKFNDNIYDIITMFDVIEHFPNPKKIIIRAKKILKKDGILIIQTPNFSSIMSKLTRLNWVWLLVPQHLFLYSINPIKYLLVKNGFKILHISTWDDCHEFINNILMTVGIKYKGKTALLHRILIKMKYILIPFSIIWNNLYLGGEILVYAKKE